MNKVIWFINEYAGAPQYGMGMRHYYLARILVKRGFKVYIFTSAYSHLLRTFPEIDNNYKVEKIDNVNFVWIKTIKYKNAHSKKRVLKWWLFSLKLLKIGLKNIFPNPDIIIASTPEIFHLLPSIYLAKKFRSKFIYEIRDIWPLSLVEIGNISRQNPLIKSMEKIENLALKKADKIISVLPNYEEYLKEKNIDTGELEIIPNGICLEDYKEEENAPKEVLEKIPKNKFIVIYTGTFGKANALEHLIKAADILKKYKGIHFILVGKGMEEENLKSLVEKLNLENITFLPPVSKKQIQDLLRRSDICYIGLKKERIFNYGVSPNKIFDYMYAGKPIIYAINSGNNIVKDANCGVSVEAENPKSIAEGILKLYKMNNTERKILGKNGKKYLLKYHTYKVITDKFEEILND